MEGALKRVLCKSLTIDDSTSMCHECRIGQQTAEMNISHSEKELWQICNNSWFVSFSVCRGLRADLAARGDDRGGGVAGDPRPGEVPPRGKNEFKIIIRLISN